MASTENRLYGPPVWRYDSFPNHIIEAQEFSWRSNEPLVGAFESDRAIADKDYHSYTELANLNPGMGNSYLFPNLTPTTPYTQTPFHQRFLNDSKAAEFLAVRGTQGRRYCWY